MYLSLMMETCTSHQWRSVTGTNTFAMSRTQFPATEELGQHFLLKLHQIVNAIFTRRLKRN